MRQFFHDYETYCDLDLKVVGTEVYCRHPSFEILMCSYAMDNDPVKLWVPAEGEPMPQEFMDAHNSPDVLLSGFNVSFERACTRWGLVWNVPASRYRCTMAKAYGLSFFGGLEAVGEQIGIPMHLRKDAAGKRYIQRFGKPAPKNHKAKRYDRFSHPEEWNGHKGYCKQDSEAERYISQWCDQYDPISAEEWDLWALDQEINQNGIPVDLEAAHRALGLHKEARGRIIDEMRRITGLDNPNSTQQLDGWLREKHGAVMPNFQAETIEATIKLGLIPEEALRILDLKRKVGMTAPTKWKAFINRAGADDIVRGMFTYAGASRTRRWASRGINLQNLKKPPFSNMEAAIWFIKHASLDLIDALYGDPIEFLAGTVRGCIAAPEGEHLAVSDLGSIESRVVGWMADCKWINEAFANGLDTYKLMAVDIYHTAYDAVTPKQRTFSKPVVLAGPYGQGAKGLVTYAAGRGVELTQEEAKHHVNTFRERCYEIVNMWGWLERSIFSAVRTGGRHEGYKVKIYMAHDNQFLFIELPSGRRLAYYQPRIEPKTTPWGEVKPTFTYMGKHKDKAVWVRNKTHMGGVTENIVQAIARDILAHGLKTAKAWGLFIILHVHDEIVARVSSQFKAEWLEKLNKALCVVPSWAEGLLLSADGFTTKNYRKD